MEITPVTLAYEEHGQGTPLILVHGFPFDRTIWYPIIPLLKDAGRLILVDLRGFGQSPFTEGIYSMRLMAEDLLALMDKLGIDKAVIAGHSMGGYVSLAFAHAFPSRLAGLGLIATQAGADSPEKRQSRIKQAEEIRRKGTKSLLDSMAARLSPYESMRPALIEIMAKTNPKAVIAALKGMAERSDASEWLTSIEVPAAVVHGVQDALIGLEVPRAMAQMLPRGWMVELACAGHMPMIETPPGVADPLRMLLGMAKNRE